MPACLVNTIAQPWNWENPATLLSPGHVLFLPLPQPGYFRPPINLPWIGTTLCRPTGLSPQVTCLGLVIPFPVMLNVSTWCFWFRFRQLQANHLNLNQVTQMLICTLCQQLEKLDVTYKCALSLNELVSMTSPSPAVSWLQTNTAKLLLSTHGL